MSSDPVDIPPATDLSGDPAVELSVVVPAFREEGRIGRTLEDLVPALERAPRTSELVLVNDGSDDGTQAVLERWRRDEPRGSLRRIAVVSHDKNRGKGAAVRTGLAASSGRWRLIMDADNACRVSQVERLFERAGPTIGMVAGSRRSADARVTQSRGRGVVSALFRATLRALGLAGVADTQCGFKLYRDDLARLLASHSVEEGFVFDVEHLALARAAGLGVAEVGVEWNEQAGSTVRPVRDGLRMLAGAVRIRWRLRRGLPNPARSEVEAKPSGVIVARQAHGSSCTGAEAGRAPQP